MSNTNIKDHSTSSITTTVSPTSSSTSQACAACKHQRRKCSPDCVLRPYFPAHHHTHFINTHKLFGVCNILKFLRLVRPSEREMTVKTMVFEANVRESDRVGGCYRIICDLHRQIDRCLAELNLVIHQIAICRAKVEEMQNPNMGNIRAIVSFDDPYNVQGMDFIDNNDSYSLQGVQDKQVLVDELEDIKPPVGFCDEKVPIQSSDIVVLKEVDSTEQKQKK